MRTCAGSDEEGNHVNKQKDTEAYVDGPFEHCASTRCSLACHVVATHVLPCRARVCALWVNKKEKEEHLARSRKVFRSDTRKEGKAPICSHSRLHGIARDLLGQRSKGKAIKT